MVLDETMNDRAMLSQPDLGPTLAFVPLWNDHYQGSFGQNEALPFLFFSDPDDDEEEDGDDDYYDGMGSEFDDEEEFDFNDEDDFDSDDDDDEYEDDEVQHDYERGVTLDDDDEE